MRLARLAMIALLSIAFLSGCATKGIDKSLDHDFSVATKQIVGLHDRMRKSDFGYDRKALFGKIKQITHYSSSGKYVYSFDVEGKLTNLWYQFSGLNIYTSEEHIYLGDRLISLERKDSSGGKEVDSLIYDINGNLIEVQTSGYFKKTRKYHYEAAGRGRTIVSWVDSDDPTVWRWELDSITSHLVSIRRPAWDTLFDCKEDRRKGTRTCIKTTIHSNPKPKVQRTLEVEQSDGLPVMEVSLLGEAGSTQTDYTHTFDSTGNWVRREVVRSRINADGIKTPIETYVHVREIIYY